MTDPLAPLLECRRLSVITRDADFELARIQDRLDWKVLVDGRTELDEALGRLLAIASRRPVLGPRTLDLIGHSMPGSSLLGLGDWVIDAGTRQVTAFFRELAEHEVLPRLGIVALRLLGCETAATRRSRSTMRALSNLLGLEVYGATAPIYSAHFDRFGLSEDANHVLVASSDLPSESYEMQRVVGEPDDRAFDVDSLPALPLAVGALPWPRRIGTAGTARSIIRLIRRTGGQRVIGLLASPSCELALPSTHAGRYHIAQMLFEGELVRVYPDGDTEPGVVYAVEDPNALRAIVDRLPPVV